jgi:hypothetical protein
MLAGGPPWLGAGTLRVSKRSYSEKGAGNAKCQGCAAPWHVLVPGKQSQTGFLNLVRRFESYHGHKLAFRLNVGS